jgi:DNA modification methylase
MTPYTLKCGDCRNLLKTLPDNSVDSLVTDAPYELGFMSKSWDASGIAYDVDMWRECLRVVKPGGHLLACGGSRTFHRLTCAIEDAGWSIRDCLMWLYSNGFPKSRSCLKPAYEPIVLARKPCETTAKANVVKFGTGALNIEACRIGHSGGTAGAGAGPKGPARVYGNGLNGAFGVPVEGLGRWP